MTIKALSIVSLVISTLTVSALAQNASSPKPSAPAILGHATDLFKVGPLLASDDFENLENWVVQLQERPGGSPAKIEAKEGTLDCFVPGRGCTVWFKQKLKTRVTITYDVICPTPKPAIEGIVPRDINNFWMARDPKGDLFDSTRYTGKFASYDKMHSYYASTGGGSSGATANLTTRMRRYPRVVDGKPADHLALNDKDKNAEHLITPDKVMRVQLVAYDDVIQYIVDGKLTYEIASGDKIKIEGRDIEGNIVTNDAVYDLKRFPVYREGYFGFRMVGTHHIYSNFRVYSLEPSDGSRASKEDRGTAPAFSPVIMAPGLTTIMAGKWAMPISMLRSPGNELYSDVRQCPSEANLPW